MIPQPAYAEVTLAHGGITVRLRPTLRAAVQLERLHDGFEPLFRKVDEFDTGTVRAIIVTAASERSDAIALMTAAAQLPLREVKRSFHAPVIALCRGLIPTAEAKDDKKAPRAAKPLPWADAYRQLFKLATGWLEWTPQATWDATPDEIVLAFEGHLEKLKAIHGAPEEEDNGPSEEQRAANEAAGLDPEFDRAGLQSLKAALQGGL